MQNATKFIGLDVSKEKIAVAIASQGREEVRYFGTIAHTKDAVRKLMNQLGGEGIHLEVCYEAGPTGYPLYWWLQEMEISCMVVAPSLIPQRPGDRVKTDKRDAMRLASLLRAGELVSVYVPTAKEEVFRDLVRAREDAKEDLNRHYQRLGKFLLRHQIVQPAKMKSGTTRYEVWLDSIRFEDKCLSVVFQEYRQTVREGQERIKRYDREIEQQAETGEYPLVTALQALRGIALVTAATLAVEIGNIARFAHPRQLMSYAGLVPSEHSSGAGRWQGRITKAGNAHLRRVVVEAAKSYRHVPGVRQALRKRLDGLSPALQELSWKAQVRLHRKAKGMLCRGKHSGTIAVAVARELLGFVWAVAQELEKERQVA